MAAYLLLTLTAFTGQALLVVPIVPILLSAGALAHHGEMVPALAIVALAAGIVPGDYVWYVIGRKRGSAILKRVCRMALEPGSCVRRTQNFLGRYGARALLVAKFVPGLSTVALPMAGVYGMKVQRFFLFDGIGVLMWCTTYVLIGYGTARGLTRAAPEWFRVDTRALIWVLLAALGYLVWKYARRRRRVRRIWTDRITAEDLRERLAAGETLTVVDLRHPLDFEADPYVVPGALYIPADQIADRHGEIPRTAEIILYCTCPDEGTSVKEAMRLKAKGVGRVRPLEGGFDGWRERGFPVQFRGPVLPDEHRILNAA